MSYDTERVLLKRRPVLVCEIDLDSCPNIYGTAFGSNILTQENDFTHADWSKAWSVITTTDTIEDANAAAVCWISQEPAIDITERHTLSLVVTKDAVPKETRYAMILMSFLTGGSLEDHRLAFDTSTGEHSLVIGDGADVEYGVEDLGTEWHVWISSTPIDQANSNCRVNIAPAFSTYSGGVWNPALIATLGIIEARSATLAEGVLQPYGAVTCNATGGVGDECYNTRSTCHSLNDYVLGDSKVHRFSDAPVEGESLIPCISSTELAPTVINPSKGMGQRASIRVNMNDFSYHDRGIDPYVSTRVNVPEETGTYFGKLISRNKHHNGRPLRIKTGYISDNGFSFDDFQTRNYIIETITGPGPSGKVEIGAKDILKLADDKRALCPPPSTGLLLADINSSVTSLSVTSGTESEYDDSEYIRAGDEIIFSPIANRAANVFSNLTRGSWNTDASDHDEGDSVQHCKHLDTENVVDFVEDLLVNYGNVSSAYINATDWQAEEDRWFATNDIATLITAPEGVTTLLQKLSEQFQFQIWWNEIDQEIIFKAIVPPSAVTPPRTLTEEANLIEGKTSVEREEERRISRVIVYYNPHNPINVSDPEHFKSVYMIIDADAESVNEYADSRHKIIYAEFMSTLSDAITVGGRLLNRFAQVLNSVKLSLDAKDSDFWTGDLVNVETSKVQNPDGSDRTVLLQVMSVKENTRDSSGSQYDYKLLEVGFGNRYGFIGPDTLNDYDVESDENKLAYGFIAPDTGGFTDGEPSYRII